MNHLICGICNSWYPVDDWLFCLYFYFLNVKINIAAFWQKKDVTYQQPDVKFKGEYLFLAESNINERIVTCSSFHQYNQYVESLDNCSSIKVIINIQKYSINNFFVASRLGQKLRQKDWRFPIKHSNKFSA